MDKDKLPPPCYPSSKSGPAASSSSPLQIPNSDTNRFSADVSLMPDFPTRNLGGHRRAHSEIVSLPDDLSFDMVGPNSVDETEAEDDFLAMYLDMDKIGGTSDLVGGGASSSSYYGLGERGEGGESGERVTRVRHQHSQSMDGSMTMIKAEEFVGVEGGVVGSLAEAKKAMSAAAKLPDLALVDPKRAKRIWANRQSAARSKERKMRYIAELERKVQTLQTEATTLSAQLSMLQRDTTGLTSENNELKLRLQNMEQQVHLQDALNDALREEVQGLKMATGQKSNGSMMNFGPSNFGGNQQQFYHNQAMHPMMAAQQLQQLQIHSQHPQHQQHQYQHQQQQPPSDLRMRGSMAPQNQRENAANSSSASINEM